ncbi:MAG: helix-turn-helix domain-containing protein [Synergistaceae bacterium]|nr:helix-turn-helix domain-containing protein [Synergistaceae bacterium]
MEKFVTVSQAAQIMKRSTGYLRRLCIDGKLRGAQKMGSQWVIPRETIENYKPAPQGFAAVWQRKREAERALLNEFLHSVPAQSMEAN